MSLYSMLAGKGPSGFGYGTTAAEVVRGLSLTGKTILITGCNSGIGLESMRVLVEAGATVIGAARSLDKAQLACASVLRSRAEPHVSTRGEAIPVACELSEPSSVRACVAELAKRGAPLDVILCNAGIMALPKLQTKYGCELQLFTNHVGHFLLVTGLLDKLASDGRVIMLSSDAHRGAPKGGIQLDNLAGDKGYSSWQAYGQSKLANLLFAKQLARRFQGQGRIAHAVHPGVIPTNLDRHMSSLVGIGWFIGTPLFLKSIPEGAATQVWAAVHPDAGRIQGEYLSSCNVSKPSSLGNDMALAERLWTATEQLVARLPA